MSIREVSLYFREGSSDKVYQAQLEASGDGYVVNFQYGRRGGNLQTGTKTINPVDLIAATKIYSKLVGEKTSKGYTHEETGIPFASNENAGERSGLDVQLLNVIREDDLEAKFKDDTFIMQEKFDGERRPVSMKSGAVVGGNKLGLTVGIPKAVESAVLELSELHQNLDLDAEIISDRLYIFDVLQFGERDMKVNAYSNRLRAMALIDTVIAVRNLEDHLHVVETAYTDAEKRDLFARIKARNGEGAVFKKLHATYTPGRPNSGGDQFKFKFYEQCTVIVKHANEGKRSVAIQLLDDDGVLTDVGNVTIPEKVAIPNAGDLVEVQYLYAYRGGSLYQPSYLHPRNDVLREECVFGQLKYKPEEPARKPKP